MSVVHQLPNLDIGIDNLLKIAKLTKLDLEFWVDGDSGRMRSVGGWTFRGISGPHLGFLGGSAEGSSELVSVHHTLEKLVILAAIALEHTSQIFSHARASFGHIF